MHVRITHREWLVSTFLFIILIMKRYLIFFALAILANITFANNLDWEKHLMKNIFLTLMVFGIVGCAQPKNNIWICDNKTITQDERESWADRVALMRFIFDFTGNQATFVLVSYPRLMDYVSIEDWHIVNDFTSMPSNETSLHKIINGAEIDIQLQNENDTVIRFGMMNVKTNSLVDFKLVKQQSNNQLAQWDDSMANYNCIKI
jgi:hypothetical protein